MEYGYIVLASTKGEFIPNAIKWFTNSVFSHSLMTMPEILGIPMCIEAAENGVDMTRFDIGYIQNKNQSYQVWKVKISKKTKDKALSIILNDLEISYGFLEYLYFIVRRLCLFFGKDIKSTNNFITNGMICSQLCVAYLNACGLQHTMDGYGVGSIAPQDLQNIFKANPKVFELVEEVRL